MCGWQCQGRAEGKEKEEGGRSPKAQAETIISKSSETLRDSCSSHGGEWARGQKDGEMGSTAQGLIAAETLEKRWRARQSREGWGADRYHSPGPQHRKSFIFGSACCQLPLSTQKKSRTLIQLWKILRKTACTQHMRPVKIHLNTICVPLYTLHISVGPAIISLLSTVCRFNTASSLFAYL